MNYNMWWSVDLSQDFLSFLHGRKANKLFFISKITNTCCVSSKYGMLQFRLALSRPTGRIPVWRSTRAWDKSSPSSKSVGILIMWLSGGGQSHRAGYDMIWYAVFLIWSDRSAGPGIRLLWRYSENTEVTCTVYLCRDYTEFSAAGHF